MGDERKAAMSLHPPDERSGIAGKGSRFLFRAQHEQMILLWRTVLIVHLLPRQHEHLAPSQADIALHAADEDVVIGDDHRVQAAPDGRGGEIRMVTGAVRLAGVHMQIDKNFFHGRSAKMAGQDEKRRKSASGTRAEAG